MYKNIPACTANGAGRAGNTGCLSNVGTFPGTTVQNPGVQGDNTSFYQDQYRETKQTAFFASADFDIIPKVLTLTAGTRHFQFENSHARQRAVELRLLRRGHARGRLPRSGLQLQPRCRRICATPSPASRAAATSPGTSRRTSMVYYTFSQGFRPGGFNQNGGAAACHRHRTGWRST